MKNNIRMCLIEDTPWSLSDHHSTIVPRGLRKSWIRPPWCWERRKSLGQLYVWSVLSVIGDRWSVYVWSVTECSQHPVNLEPVDLWLRPVAVAEFLRNLPFFDLPEGEGPPREPSPSNSCAQFSFSLFSSKLFSLNFFRPIHFVQSY